MPAVRRDHLGHHEPQRAARLHSPRDLHRTFRHDDRVVDVNAATIGAQGEAAMHGNVQWASVLRSVAGLQMFRRSTNASATGSTVVAFFVRRRIVPAIGGLLRRAGLAVAAGTAQTGAALESVDVLAKLSRSIEVQPLDLVTLRRSVDEVQRASADLHAAVTAQYFAVRGRGMTIDRRPPGDGYSNEVGQWDALRAPDGSTRAPWDQLLPLLGRST